MVISLVRCFALFVFISFFEGLALATTVIDSKFSRIKSLAIVIGFGFTTPIGIIIGIVLHKSFITDSPVSLWTQGIFDSISAGILIYTALIEFMTPEITFSKRFRQESIAFKVTMYLSLWSGVASMAIIGLYV